MNIFNKVILTILGLVFVSGGIVFSNGPLSHVEYSTYIGGSSAEDPSGLERGGIARDSDGNIYVIGQTQSNDYPVTPGAYDETYNDPAINNLLGDCVISKFDPTFTELLASTYFGGSAAERCTDIEIDAADNVYIAISTQSTNLPTTTDSYDQTMNNRDIYLAKFDSGLTTVVDSTYFGGTSIEIGGADLEIAGDGSVYVGFYSVSSDVPLVGTPFQTNQGGLDNFIAHFDSNLTTLLHSTYLGGSGNERQNVALGIANNGDVMISTHSASTDFPMPLGAYSPANTGLEDIVIAILDPTLATLEAATYFGGSDFDHESYYGGDIIQDAAGDIYIVGSTRSSDFPITAGAYDSVFDVSEGYIAKFDTGLTTLKGSTFVGGVGTDALGSLELTSSGDLVFLGFTDGNLIATTDAFDDSSNGIDHIVGIISPDLSMVSQLSFIGGDNNDLTREVAESIIVDGECVYIAGGTESFDSTFFDGNDTTTGYPLSTGSGDVPYQGNNGGGIDIALTKMCPASCGDNVVQDFLGEECDDENTVSGDGCSATCKIEIVNPVNPGGVSSSLTLRLHAGAGTDTTIQGDTVDVWEDLSPIGFDATSGSNSHRPLYEQNGLNFNPTITYPAGDNDIGFTLGGNYIYSPAANGGMHIFTAAIPSVSGQFRSVVDFGSYNANNYGIYMSSSELALAERGYTSLTFGNVIEPYLGEAHYDFVADEKYLIKNGNTPIKNDMHYDELTAAEIKESPTHQDSSGPVSIGRQSKNSQLDNNGGKRFTGELGEVIIYNGLMTDAEIAKVRSYLALKYGVELMVDQNYFASDSSLMWDGGIDSDYVYNVFGIGRDDDSGLDQRVSKSINSGTVLTVSLDDDFVSVNNATARTTEHTNNLQFLTVSTDQRTVVDNRVEMDFSVYSARINREWLVQKKDFTDLVNLQFDGLDNTYALLVDIDGDFSTTADQTNLGHLDNNGEITGIDFADNIYFTLAIPYCSAGTGVLNNGECEDGSACDANGDADCMSGSCIDGPTGENVCGGTPIVCSDLLGGVENNNECGDGSSCVNNGAADCASGICDETEEPTPLCESSEMCGNSVLETTEGCDDGNTMSGDGCDMNCLVEDLFECNSDMQGETGGFGCASGVCDETESPSICEPVDTCGNSILESGEGCDDGNEVSGDGCSDSCLLENTEICNATGVGEQGDDGCESGYCNIDAGAPGVCDDPIVCGNGELEIGEGCDDNNTVANDGCSATCLIENDGICNEGGVGLIGADSCESGVCDISGIENICEPADSCGNSVLESGEACDDGNTLTGDGCTATCKIEIVNTVNPGGVSGSLALRLHAGTGTDTITQGDGVDVWEDLSVNGFDATSGANSHRPLYEENSLNYNPSLTFPEGDNDIGFNLGSNYIFAPNENGGMHIFTAALPTKLNNRKAIVDFGSYNANNYGLYMSTDQLALAERGYSTLGSPANNTTAIGEAHFDFVADRKYLVRSGNESSGNQLHWGQLTDVEINEAPMHQATSGPVSIGRASKNNDLDDDFGRRFFGDLGEVIMYNGLLTDAEIFKVRSYLALKYGVELGDNQNYFASDDSLMWDLGVDSSYQSNVFGIGRDDDSGLDQRISTSMNLETIVTVSLDDDFLLPDNDVVRTTSHTNDLQFLTISNNFGILGGSNFEIDLSTYSSRIPRERLVQKKDFTQPVNLKFDGLDNTYALLVDVDGDFTTKTDQTNLGNLDSNGEIAGINFADNIYFTLAIPICSEGIGVLNNSECEDGSTCDINGAVDCASGVCDETESTPVCESSEMCGNSVLESGEGCDDGNEVSGDGCSDSCLLENTEICNTSGVGEEGDDGCVSGYCNVDGGVPGVCDDPTCGNGELEIGEGCDDNNTVANDGCSATCLIENDGVCNENGVGLLGADSCESGICDISGTENICEPANSCGNNVLEAGEGCDDGNILPGDGCNEVCKVENDSECNQDAVGVVGNGSCESGACDDVDGLPGVCVIVCSVGEGVENNNECIDGANCENNGNEDCAGVCDTTEANAVCESESTCGNGLIEISNNETCDDGNVATGDGCDTLCKIENTYECTENTDCASDICDDTENTPVCEPTNTCGNNILEAGEGCDDGNVIDGDDCDMSCFIELGDECNEDAAGETGEASCASGACNESGGIPGVCVIADICGNYILESGEGCDDGNTESDDGCSDECKVENENNCNQDAAGVVGNESCESGACNDSEGLPGVCAIACSQGAGVENNSECENGAMCENNLELDCASGYCDEDIFQCDDEPMYCSIGSGIEDNYECIDGASCENNDDADCASAVCDDTEVSPICESELTCGNGLIEISNDEVCDDGNTDNGDGCSFNCLLEDGIICDESNDCDSGNCDVTEDPSVCEPIETCGNSILEAGEGCDDGNTLGLDGCNVICQLENGEECNVDSNGLLGAAGCVSGLCDITGGEPGICEEMGVCGNSVVDNFEGCDDGNTIDGDGCNASCKIENMIACGDTEIGLIGSDSCESGLCNTAGGAPGICELGDVCGNSVLEDREACDDGNNIDGDGCNAFCRIEDTYLCNQGLVGHILDQSCESGICDTTETNDVCEPADTCGNSIVEGSEVCDDGNTNNEDGCSSTCLLEDGEVCDADSVCQSGNCDDTQNQCEPIDTCGNSILEIGEGCDDGNTLSEDGCSTVCLIEVGETCNTITPGEIGDSSCETGNCNETGLDRGICEPNPPCGNGVLEVNEGCDDGGTKDGDGCSSICLIENETACNEDTEGEVGSEGCASGVCDETGMTDRCEPVNTCGNGLIEMGEACDDGDTINGDGCSDTCLLEDTIECAGNNECDSGNCDLTEENIVCEPVDTCGNSILETGEGCDDGNVIDGDGCNDLCKIENTLICNQDVAGLVGNNSCVTGYCDASMGSLGVCDDEPTVCTLGEGVENNNECIDGSSCENNGAVDCESGVCDATGIADLCEPSDVCGNSVLDGDEVCDDGNLDSGDGCSSACLLEDAEECDTNLVCQSGNCDLTELPSVCEPTNACGNSIVEIGEGCDDGNRISGDGCSVLCLIEIGEVCNTVAPGEIGAGSCETGICDTTGGVGLCETNLACGNNIVEIGEGCDDGDILSGDGCSSVCLIENEVYCNEDASGAVLSEGCESGICDTSETKAICEPIDSCGNGVLEAGEGCDDGNITNGDACDALCKIEDTFVCNQNTVGLIDGVSCVSGYCDESGLCDQEPEVITSIVCTEGTGVENNNECIEGSSCVNNGNEDCLGVCDKTEVDSVCEPLDACGNSVIEEGEECDDGNIFADDGCSDVCVVEIIGGEIPEDTDGIPIDEEEGGPLGDDVNSDGVSDGYQGNVITAINGSTGVYGTTILESETCNPSNSKISFYSEEDFAVTDADFDYEAGFHGFETTCVEEGSEVKITYFTDKVYDTSTWNYRKYLFSSDEYVDFNDNVSYSTQKVNGIDVTVVTYSIIDGGKYDSDGIVNGVVIDPIGLGTQLSAIPVIIENEKRGGGRTVVDSIVEEGISMDGIDLPAEQEIDTSTTVDAPLIEIFTEQELEIIEIIKEKAELFESAPIVDEKIRGLTPVQLPIILPKTGGSLSCCN